MVAAQLADSEVLFCRSSGGGGKPGWDESSEFIAGFAGGETSFGELARAPLAVGTGIGSG